MSSNDDKHSFSLPYRRKEVLNYWAFELGLSKEDRLCGLVVRVSGYRYRGLGFDSRRYQIF